jgi:hypothetical protein
MADLGSDGNFKVSWVTTISNIAAPTVAELNAGLALESYITPDGLDISADTSPVDNSALSSTFNTATAGRRAYTINLTIKKQTPRVWENTLVYQATGYLAVRREVIQTTGYTVAQKIEIYPAQVGEPNPGYGPNEIQRGTVPIQVTAAPNTNATIA